MKDLYEGLAKARAEMGKLVADSKNPHFKNDYASLTAVLALVLPSLLTNGIYPEQTPEAKCEDGTWYVVVTTKLVYCKDPTQMSASVLSMPVGRGDAQAIGGAITYARRYALVTMLGLALDDDDDGNAASAPRTVVAQPRVERTVAMPSQPTVPQWEAAVLGEQPVDADFYTKAKSYEWPTDEGTLTVIAMATLDLSTDANKMVAYLREQDRGSDKPMVTTVVPGKRMSQYGLLASKVDERYGKDSHNTVLSILLGRYVDVMKPPKFGVKFLLDWLMNQSEHSTKMGLLDQVVNAYLQEVGDE